MDRFCTGDIENRILYEDEEILLVHKPPGLAVQNASFRTPDLESILRNRLKGAWLGVVHRLDQPVEGLVLFAKTPEAAADLGRQLTDGRMSKEYAAVVFLPEKGLCAAGPEQQQKEAPSDSSWHVLENWMFKEPRTNLSRVVSQGTRGAKRACLRWRLLETKPEKNIALLAIRLETGRHHQIRVQLAHAGMPLAGDRKYGKQEDPLSSPALCAVRLTFTRPKTGQKLSFSIIPQGEALKKICGRNFLKSV